MLPQVTVSMLWNCAVCLEVSVCGDEVVTRYMVIINKLHFRCLWKVILREEGNNQLTPSSTIYSIKTELHVLLYVFYSVFDSG